MTDTDATILIVEDDPQLNEMYSSWLDESYTVHSAHDGAGAVRRFSEHDIDLMLLDRELPDTRGETLLASQENRDSDCLVGMVSGIPVGFDALPMDFDGYLEKPARQEELQKFVEGLLNQDKMKIVRLDKATI